MSFKNLIDKELVSCSPNTTIVQAALLMKKKNTGSVLVIDDSNKPVGIITDRDIAIRCVAERADCNGKSVAEVMSQPVQIVHMSDGIYNAIEAIKRTGIRRVPIVDDSGKAVAVVSFGDLLQMLVSELSSLTTKTTAKEPKLIRKAA